MEVGLCNERDIMPGSQEKIAAGGMQNGTILDGTRSGSSGRALRAKTELRVIACVGFFLLVWPHVYGGNDSADAPTSAMVDDQGQLVGAATPRTLLREKDRLLLEIQERWSCAGVDDLSTAKRRINGIVQAYEDLRVLYRGMDNSSSLQYSLLVEDVLADIEERFQETISKIKRVDSILQSMGNSPHPALLSDAGYLRRKVCLQNESLEYFQRSVTIDALGYNNFGHALVEVENFRQAHSAFLNATLRKIPRHPVAAAGCVTWSLYNLSHEALATPMMRVHPFGKDTEVFEFLDSSAYIQGLSGTVFLSSGDGRCKIFLGPGQQHMNRFRYEPARSAFVRGEDVPTIRLSEGEWASSLQGWSRNFYHFLIEILPRTILAIEHHAKSGSKEVLNILVHDEARTNAILDGATFEFSSAFTLIEYSSFGNPGSFRLHFRKLRYVDWYTKTTSDLPVANHYVPSRFALQRLRRIWTYYHETELGTSKNIKLLYACRGAAERGKVFGENLLTQQLRKLPSVDVSVHDATRSLREQAAAFQGAHIVFGIHGAALANIVFCRTGATIVEATTNPMTEGNYFQRIAERMGLRYIPLPGVSIKYLTPLYLDELQVSRIASSLQEVITNL
eukprot:g2012.t1